jgi:hypothetical protein
MLHTRFFYRFSPRQTNEIPGGDGAVTSPGSGRFEFRGHDTNQAAEITGLNRPGISEEKITSEWAPPIFPPKRISPFFPPLEGEDEGGVGALLNTAHRAIENRESKVEKRNIAERVPPFFSSNG